MSIFKYVIEPPLSQTTTTDYYILLLLIFPWLFDKRPGHWLTSFLGTLWSLGVKFTWELHKDAWCCFQQILETAPYKTAAVLPLTAHLTNIQVRQTWRTGHCCSYKEQLISGIFPMDYSIWTHQCWPASKNLHTSAPVV